jgi:hypothetical protein
MKSARLSNIPRLKQQSTFTPDYRTGLYTPAALLVSQRIAGSPLPHAGQQITLIHPGRKHEDNPENFTVSKDRQAARADRRRIIVSETCRSLFAAWGICAGDTT